MQFLNQKSISSILLYIFIALLPVQLGTFFFFRFSYISGVKIDYLAPALYLTDICAVLLIICNARYVYKKLHKHIILILLLFLINALFASHTAIGMYHFAKILEIAGLFIVIKNIHLDYKKLIIILLVSTLVEFLLCIGQMLSASSLQGIFYYLGERSFNLSTPGIAKVSLHGKEILRPYGTFSHPNSLAGFYLLFYTFILFSQRFTHNARLKYITLGLMSLLIFLSFSKIAIITYLVVTVLYATRDLKKICWICTISKIGVALLVTYLFLQAKGDAETINKRIYLTQSAFRIIWHNPMVGTGIGNYLYAQSNIPNPYPYHFLEPVHNILLLTLAEIGIPIVIALLYLLSAYIRLIWKTPIGQAVIITVVLTGMFDHYWLTLQQNILLLPVLFALLKNEGKYDKIERT